MDVGSADPIICEENGGCRSTAEADQVDGINGQSQFALKSSINHKIQRQRRAMGKPQG